MADKLLKIIDGDKKRGEMLLQGLYLELIKSYKKTQPSFIDQNNESFWRNKIKNEYGNDFVTNQRIKFVIKELLKRNKKSLLDIGVGQAYLERKLSEVNHGIVIHGIDIIDSKFLNLFNIKYLKVKSYKNLPFKDRSFGMVTALEVMEHLKTTKTFLFLDQVHRILEKDGIFIVSVPINEDLIELSTYDIKRHGFINPNSHMRNYSEPLILWELEYSGFEILEVYRICAFKTFAFIINLLNKIIKRWQPNDLVIVVHKKK